MIIDKWHNCYPSSWKGKIVPSAFQHPAKFSSKLIQRIYAHIIEEGWVKPGDVIVDPFGGIALGAMDAMRLGLAWRGVELEAHFADIGNQNIAFWNQRFASMPKWSGDAMLLQGDSRDLAKILAAGEAVISSPPYAETRNAPGGDQSDDLFRNYHGDGNYGAVVSSPPYNDNPLTSDVQGKDAGKLRINRGEAYACISSPPFSDSLSADRVDPEERVKMARELGLSNAANVSVIDMEKAGKRTQGYAVISSPPYADGCAHEGGNDTDPSHIQGGALFGVGLAGAVASPPYASASEGTPLDPQKYPTLRGVLKTNSDHLQKYGKTSGQLGSMRATESGFQAAISSPPFTGSTADGGWQMLGEYAEQGKLTVKQVKGKKDKAYPSWSKDRDTTYAPSEDNLGNAKASDASFQAAISSPPFLQSEGGLNPSKGMDPGLLKRHVAGNKAANGYGESTGQLTNGSVDDFWMSARLIIEQVYQVLQPGGHAIWVVKDYVKNKQRVPFCDQWRELCEAVGFVAIHEHHAMLVRHNGTSLTLEGDKVEHTAESKSFFRRLAEKKGSPRIDWETVLCMEKPQ